MLLHRSGVKQRQIAKRLGISRNTVKKYIEKPDIILSRPVHFERKSLLDPYKANIDAWLEEDDGYTAVRIFERMKTMGFTGSYEIVKRRVSVLKKDRQKVAYVRFETEPGYQAQVDFGEFQIEQADGSVKKLYLFSMILGYSRKIYGELIERCDLQSFLDCHIKAFKYFGGVPEEILYDRMKNVFIGRIAGKDKFNDTLTGFALHYGYKPVVAPAYAAWVKGKVERPYSFIREGFWRGYGYVYLKTANHDLAEWLKIKEERVHGTTHEVVSQRFVKESPHLKNLPLNEFDTSYRIYRSVYKDCTVRFEGNSYVVSHKLVGKEIILKVKDGVMRIFADDILVVTYNIPEGKGHLVQDKKFYEVLKKDQEMNRRKYGNAKHYKHKGRAKHTISPVKSPYDIEVAIRPAAIYDQAGGISCTIH